MMQYGRHMTTLNVPAAHAAAAQFKDAKPADFLPFYEQQSETNRLDQQAMELSARFAKLGV